MRVSTLLLSWLLRKKIGLDEKEVRTVQISTSSSGEDLLICQLLEGKPGSYLEIGSNHPRLYNLTYALYCRGWRGVCLDPQPGHAAEFRKKRPGDLFLSRALSNQPGSFVYHEYDYDQLNHLTRQDEPPRPQGRGTLRRSRPLEAIGWSDLEQEVRRLPQPLRLLLIDAEHLSMELLLSAPFGPGFLPDLVVVEAADAQQAVQMELHLHPRGYFTAVHTRKYPANLFFLRPRS